MPDIHSTVMSLPRSCKSAAERMAYELARDDALADISDADSRKISELERMISKETGERIALVAYRVE